MKLALIQLAVGACKSTNIAKAVAKVKEAASAGARLVSLPECFNSPYGTQFFREYAESIPGGDTAKALSKVAQESKIFLVGGSIPEKDGDKIYNTCTIWNPEGCMIAKHRKVHLFDVDIPNGITFKESETLSPGKDLTVFDADECKVGVGICYDIRFSEMAQIYRDSGCKLLLYPGAFNMTTGPAHWELLIKCRALDNQVYVGAISPARDPNGPYVAWGHSTLVNPWADVVSTCSDEETIIYADLDLNYVDKIRHMIPLSNQRRCDIYEVIKK